MRTPTSVSVQIFGHPGSLRRPTNSKSEARNPKQIQSTKPKGPKRCRPTDAQANGEVAIPRVQCRPEAGLPGEFCALRPPAWNTSEMLVSEMRSTSTAGGSNAINFRCTAADSGSVRSFTRLVEPCVARTQSLGIGRRIAFDALWGTGGTAGGGTRVASLSAGARKSRVPCLRLRKHVPWAMDKHAHASVGMAPNCGHASAYGPRCADGQADEAQGT
jgi:hypothetical protein